MSIDVRKIRNDFPILNREINGRPLIYLDSAATSQKPRQVIEAVRSYWENQNANPHRAIHTLGEEATLAFEQARQEVARFINAKDPREIVFTKNATEAINLVAYSWGRANIKEGNEILLTQMEHHSNLIPWQLLVKEKGAVLKFIPITPDGQLDLTNFDKLITSNTKLVTFTYVSNALGTINPVNQIVETIRSLQPTVYRSQPKILIDAAQAVPHMPIDVQKLGADFVVFSGHKMLAPMGIGVLWARKALLEEMPPFLGGGHMIREVTLNGASWNDVPWKFEAGTMSADAAVGLAEAVKYLSEIGMDNVRTHEKELTRYAFEKLRNLEMEKLLNIYGPNNLEKRAGIITFNLTGIHPHDVASLLDEEGIAIRAGHHCTMPLHKLLSVSATCRASFYLYNTKEEIDHWVNYLSALPSKFSYSFANIPDKIRD